MKPELCPNSEQLGEFIQGKLSLPDHLAMESHVDHCDTCQDTIAVLDDESVKVFPSFSLAAPADTSAEVSPQLAKLVAQAKQLGWGFERGQNRDSRVPAEASQTWPNEIPKFEAGTVLGNYVLAEPLGGGSMGFVYKAYHKRMKRNVALKFISPRLLHSADAVRRFQREIEVVGKLNHPNIVTAYDADEVDGYCFLVMELVTGDDLREVVKKADGRLSMEQALRYVLQAARGLQYAHEVGVVHRDIKPSNLLLDEQGNVKVADLGLARLEQVLDEDGATGNPEGQDDVSRTGIIAGTPAFMAPEQCFDLRSVDHRADIYSLGCTLFFLLTGRTAYEERGGIQGMLAQHAKQVPEVRSLRADCPEDCLGAVDAFCRSMMATAPDERPANMAEVVEQIESLLVDLHQPTPVAITKPASKRPVVVLTGIGLALLVAIMFVLAGPFNGGKSNDAEVVAGNPNADPGPTTAASEDSDASGEVAGPKVELAEIPAGKFIMGSPNEDEFPADERPAHEVTISKAFMLGKFEITAAEFAEVMGESAKSFRDDGLLEVPEPPSAADVGSESAAASEKLPAVTTWLGAVEFCNRLSERNGLKPYYRIEGNTVSVIGGDGYRLPTEAEWEYACRAGSETRWHFGDDVKNLEDFAWFGGNSKGELHSVGSKKPNAFGLHDMHGNVPEWCWDRYDPEYYKKAEVFDPVNSSATGGGQRVFRGGSARDQAEQTRSAVRGSIAMTYGVLNRVGFRVARSIAD